MAGLAAQHGVEKPRHLADALGMSDIDRERRVRRWMAGDEPNYRYTLMLLKAAGLLCSKRKP